MRDESGCGSILIFALILGGLYYCSRPSAEEKAAKEQAVISGQAPSPSGLGDAVSSVDPIRGEFNEDRAEDAAHDFLSGETYESINGSVSCVGECSGHQAGWKWAQDGNSCDTTESNSFDEGCAAYDSAVEERVEDARTRYNNGDNTFAGDGE